MAHRRSRRGRRQRADPDRHVGRKSFKWAITIFTFSENHLATFIKNLIKFYSSQGYGWSEVHYRQSTSDVPNLAAQINYLEANIIPARVNLLGQECSVVGYRVSYPTPNGTAAQGRRKFFPSPNTEGGAAPALSLALQWTDVTNTKSKITHLRGFWDAVEFEETYRPDLPAAGNWQALLVAWKTAMTQGSYGWLTRDPANSKRGRVTNYVIATNGIVTFTVVGTQDLTPLVGTTQSVKFSGLNYRNSPLNTNIICAIESPTTFVSLSPIGAGPFLGQGKFNIRVTTFTAYNDTGSISLGERRMGKPSDRYPGRSKARPRY